MLAQKKGIRLLSEIYLFFKIWKAADFDASVFKRRKGNPRVCKREKKEKKCIKVKPG